MKINKLRIEDVVDQDFSIIGLVSDLKEYKLVYYFNKEFFGQFFNKIQNLDILINKKEFSYSMFESFDNQLDASIFILKNKPEINLENIKNLNKENFKSLFDYSPLLVPELKNCNYILKINNSFNLDLIVSFLRIFNKIQFFHLFPINNKKTIKNLIF